MIVSDADAGISLFTLIERALAGEDVVFERGGKPVARIQPLAQRGGKARTFGRLRHLAVSDEVFAPLSEDELALWE